LPRCKFPVGCTPEKMRFMSGSPNRQATPERPRHRGVIAARPAAVKADRPAASRDERPCGDP
ncbi:MAG: hypothetical protein V3T57_10675, partial [Kiloniellales bacterium]